MGAKARLKDVARAAGVSQGTASNVFNRPERVRPEVRERVEAAARDLNYAGPDPKARLLRAGKVNAIGVVPPAAGGIAAAFATAQVSRFMRGVAEECDARGASLTLVAGSDDDKAAGIGHALVDGLILYRLEDAQLLAARRRGVPFVVMDVDGDAETSSVRIDDRGGARAAAEHLVGLGHRRFGIVSMLRENREAPVFHAPGSPQGLVAGYVLDRERLSGYAKILAAAGISIADVPVVEARADSDANAERGAEMLFDLAPDVTAVLTMTDPHALAVIRVARRHGRSVPHDLSVVGFDDNPDAALSDPPLTTVAQPIAAKGRAAARILFAGGSPRHEVLPVSLIVRESTAPPPVAIGNRRA